MPVFTLRHLLVPALTATLSACAGDLPRSAAATTLAPSAPAQPPDEAPVPPDITDAIRVRREFGLRSDEAWVRAVAANPDAVTDFGVPLLAWERDQIMNRPGGEDPVVGVIQTYLAEHADISGGVYIDQQRGGIITILVVGDPAVHETAIRDAVGADARFAVRRVRWTEAELNDLQNRLVADRPFFRAIPAFLSTTSADIIGNVVEISISSAVPDAAQRIVAHFGIPPEMLRVSSDGTGLLLQPTGRILGRVVAPPGTDMTMLHLQYEADVDIGPRDAIGIGVDAEGRFVIDSLPPTTYTVTILEFAAVGNIEVGSARGIVPPGGAVALEILYERP